MATFLRSKKMFEFLGCSIAVPAEHMSAIVRTESAANPYAVGVVGQHLSRQPVSEKEAHTLISQIQGKYNYSVGLAQVNQSNFDTFGLNSENMFDVCSNLQAGSQILKICHEQYQDWSKAYSCYYSGNAITGFRHGYVAKVLKNFSLPILTSLTFPNHRKEDRPIQLFPQKQGGSTAKALSPPKLPSLRQRRLGSSLSPKN